MPKQTGLDTVITTEKLQNGNLPPLPDNALNGSTWELDSGGSLFLQPPIPSSSSKLTNDTTSNYNLPTNTQEITDSSNIENKVKSDNNKSSKGVDHEGLKDSGESSEKTEEYNTKDGALVNFSGYNGGQNPQVGGNFQDFLNKQKQQFEKAGGTDNLKGFTIPWDKWGRISTSYSNTQSIGNKMPYGAEWVGSPSIMNEHALIRFEQIAGRTHHTLTLNQRGNYNFRTTRKRMVFKASNAENQLKLQGINQKNGDLAISKSDLEKKFGVSAGSRFSKDSTFANSNDEVKILKDTGSDELYVEVLDETKNIWKPTKLSSTSSSTIITSKNPSGVASQTQGETFEYQLSVSDEPSEVVLDVKLSEFDLEQSKTPPKNDKEVTGNDPDEKTSTAEDVNKKDNITVDYKGGWSNDPNNVLYWLFTEFQWQKCGEVLIPPSAFCNKNKPAIAKGTDKVKLIKKAQLDIAKAKVMAGRAWENTGHPFRKQYLFQPSADSDNEEILEPTATNLCNPDNWRGQEQFNYKWADFLFCTNYGWIPNNYLVTLRRFPMPIGDNGMIPDQDTNKKFLMPVAKAVTWLGEGTGNKISELTTFTSKLNWRDVESHEEVVQGNEQGAEDGSPFSGAAKFLGMVNAVTKGGGSFGAVSGWDQQRAKHDPYTDGAYYNKIYGPVNVIAKTKARARGLEFEHSINLNFHYSLREIGGINEKAAMLDVISNMLALTSNNADFWGGANRYFPNKPSYPFLGDKEGMKKWYAGDVTGFMQSVGNQLADTFKGVFDSLSEFLTNPAGALKKLATSGATLAVAEHQKKAKRPDMLAFKALLSGAPVGEWHLTIGNPFNPLMMIGNLICTGVTFTFGEVFGIDDFPEDLIVKVTLEHGKPRDKGDIESMFNRGSGRLHYAYFGKEEAWNNASSTRDSKINQWESNKSDPGGVQKGKDVKNSNVIDTSINVTKKLGESTAKEASNLAHKVGFG